MVSIYDIPYASMMKTWLLLYSAVGDRSIYKYDLFINFSIKFESMRQIYERAFRNVKDKIVSIYGVCFYCMIVMYTWAPHIVFAIYRDGNL